MGLFFVGNFCFRGLPCKLDNKQLHPCRASSGYDDDYVRTLQIAARSSRGPETNKVGLFLILETFALCRASNGYDNDYVRSLQPLQVS